MSNNLNVKVPATSANMGPGFDCLGMALNIWNSVSILDRSDDTTKVVIVGNGEEELDRGSGNLVFQAFSRIFSEIGHDVPNVTLNCENKIPLSRGLGSSSAAIVGGLVLGNEYAGKPFNKNELAIMAAEMEGHPDNVVPACLGGMQIVIYDQLLRFDRVWTLVGRPENIAESIILLREARIFRLTREINGNSATWQVRVFPYL